MQARLDANIAAPSVRSHTKHRSLLAGISYDGLGRRLSPSHAVARGKRFRCYITHRDQVTDGQPQWRLPAHDLEQVVATAAANWLDRADSEAANITPDLEASDYVAIGRAARRLATSVRDGDPPERRDAVRALVARVDVGEAVVTITLRWSALVDGEHPLAEATASITAPMARVRRAGTFA